MSSNILFGPFGKFVRFFRKETQDLSFGLFGVLLVAGILGIRKAACQYPIRHLPPGNAGHGV